MKTISANPVEVMEAVKAMGLAGYLDEPLETYFPKSDVARFRHLIESAETDRQLRNIQVGELRTSWVCTVASEKREYLHEVGRLQGWLDKGFTVGDAVEANFGVMCQIGVKFFCQFLQYGHWYSNELRAVRPVKRPLSRGLSSKVADRLGY